MELILLPPVFNDTLSRGCMGVVTESQLRFGSEVFNSWVTKWLCFFIFLFVYLFFDKTEEKWVAVEPITQDVYFCWDMLYCGL